MSKTKKQPKPGEQKPPLAGDNPNTGHNAKKESQGPNTRR